MSAITDLLDGFIDGSAPEPEIIQKWELGTIDEWKPGYVKKTWTVSKHHLMGSTLFGGCIAALADQMLAFPAITLQQDGEYCTTSNMSISYLKSAREGDLIIEAEVISRTKRSFFVEATFTQNGKLVAKASSTQLSVTSEKY